MRRSPHTHTHTHTRTHTHTLKRTHAHARTHTRTHTHSHTLTHTHTHSHTLTHTHIVAWRLRLRTTCVHSSQVSQVYSTVISYHTCTRARPTRNSDSPAPLPAPLSLFCKALVLDPIFRAKTKQIAKSSKGHFLVSVSGGWARSHELRLWEDMCSLTIECVLLP